MELIVIGAQKAGTTWLFSMLKQQPRFCFGHIKEIHYFDSLHSGFDREKRLQSWRDKLQARKGSISKEYKKYLDYVLDNKNAYTDEWYRNIFLLKPKNIKSKKQFRSVVYGEASPSYMVMPEEQIQHLAMSFPNAKPILIVRDPVRRLISGFNMIVGRRGGIDRISRDAQLRIIRSEEYGDRGNYAYGVPAWEKYFGDKLMIYPFRSITDNPIGLLREVENSFGLDRVDYQNVAKRNNSHSGRFVLDSEVLEAIKEKVEPQYTFLRARFSEQFMEKI